RSHIQKQRVGRARERTHPRASAKQRKEGRSGRSNTCSMSHPPDI
ncbi:uncharacterized protein METZ01_LOCUS472361, partial [marine metagenome]